LISQIQDFDISLQMTPGGPRGPGSPGSSGSPGSPGNPPLTQSKENLEAILQKILKGIALKKKVSFAPTKKLFDDLFTLTEDEDEEKEINKFLANLKSFVSKISLKEKLPTFGKDLKDYLKSAK
jgi:hypothetical protein